MKLSLAQKIVLAIWSAVVAGAIGGVTANYLHFHYDIERSQAFFIAGSAGYVAATVLDVFVCYMRQRQNDS